MHFKRFLAVGIIIILFLAAAVANSGEKVLVTLTPTETIKASASAVKAISSDRVVTDAELEKRLYEVMLELFDFNDIVKRTLARHYTKERGEKITAPFIKLLWRVYFRRSQAAFVEGSSIRYLDEKVIKQSSGAAPIVFVNTEVSIKGEKHLIKFRMQDVQGEWKISDISFEGISLVSNYRSQFNKIILRNGFDALVVELNRKVEK